MSVEILIGVKSINTLCWDAHIAHLIKKCNYYLVLLSKIKVFLSRRNIIHIYIYIYLILISDVLSGVIGVLHCKIPK